MQSAGPTCFMISIPETVVTTAFSGDSWRAATANTRVVFRFSGRHSSNFLLLAGIAKRLRREHHSGASLARTFSRCRLELDCIRLQFFLCALDFKKTLKILTLFPRLLPGLVGHARNGGGNFNWPHSPAMNPQAMAKQALRPQIATALRTHNIMLLTKAHLTVPARCKKMTRVTLFKGVIEPLWCAAMSAGSVEWRTAI